MGDIVFNLQPQMVIDQVGKNTKSRQIDREGKNVIFTMTLIA